MARRKSVKAFVDDEAACSDDDKESEQLECTSSMADFIVNDCPIENEAALNAERDLYDMTNDAEAYQVMRDQIACGARDPRTLAPTATGKRGRGRPKKAAAAERSTTRLARVLLSITVWCSGNLPENVFHKGARWMDQMHEMDPDFAGFLAFEKGPQAGNMHVQMVVNMFCAGARQANSAIRKAFGLNDVDENKTKIVPDGKVMAKSLTGVNLHTWRGMLGYCQKDHARPWYLCHVVNVEPEELEEGIKLYIAMGSGDLKKRSILDAKTLMFKIDLWYRYKCLGRENANDDVVTILRDMLRSGLYMPSMSWICPPGAGGMNEERLKAVFKLAVKPEDTTNTDVRMIFMSPDYRNAEVRQTYIDEMASCVLRGWQRELVEIIALPPPDRVVQWWWEPVGNAGKTFMGKYLTATHNAVVCQFMKKEDMLHVLCKRIKSSTRIVVFDLVRTSQDDALRVVYEVLEMVKDRLLSSGKYESQQMYIPKVHVVVFANYPPDETAMSFDRWEVKEIE